MESKEAVVDAALEITVANRWRNKHWTDLQRALGGHSQLNLCRYPLSMKRLQIFREPLMTI